MAVSSPNRPPVTELAVHHALDANLPHPTCADRLTAQAVLNLPAVTLQRDHQVLADYVCRACFIAW